MNINLAMCNRDSTPTFHFPSFRNRDNWKEVLHVHLLTDNVTFRVGELKNV